MLDEVTARARRGRKAKADFDKATTLLWSDEEWAADRRAGLSRHSSLYQASQIFSLGRVRRNRKEWPEDDNGITMTVPKGRNMRPGLDLRRQTGRLRAG